MAENTDRLSTALADRYRIVSHLGEGGMATVYLAEDLKHKRKVAVKVLKPELSAILGAERFLQEIELTASLQHPNILPLYDSGTAGDTVSGTSAFLYYVMPFIEGESLRDRLDREKQLGVEESIEIAKSVAAALDYAHRHEVVHRDIKPENILINDGQALVADFGIALAVSAAGGKRMTETGLSIGTPHYMSPEQASADRELDGRSDVYSLGATLYEMLAGTPPFVGASAQAVVAKILTAIPAPLTVERPSVPPHVDATVTKALAKLPADRFSTAADFAAALTNPGLITSNVVPAAFRTSHLRRGVLLAWIASVVTAGLIGYGLARSAPESRGPVAKFNLRLAEGEGLGLYTTIAISPDGSRIAYPGESRYWVRERSELAATAIRSGAGGDIWTPFFSPDGRRLAYFTGYPGSLEVYDLDGNPPVTLVRDSAMAIGGAWSEEGWLYFGSMGGGLMRVRENGEDLEEVAVPDAARSESSFRFPDLLPGGEHLLVTVWRDRRDSDIAIVDVESGSRTTIAQGVVAQYVPPGYVAIGRADGSLSAAVLDLERRELVGPLRTVIDGLAVGDATALAVADDGTLVYARRSSEAGHVVRLTRDGARVPVDSTWQGTFGSIALSPTGEYLAFSQAVQGREELWVKTLDSGPVERLAFEGALNYRPAWSPDGRHVAFISDRLGGQQSVFRTRADGSGESELVVTAARGVDEVIWSPNGEWIVYRTGVGGGRDIYAVRTSGDTVPVPLLTSDFEEHSPSISPNNRWLLYASEESRQPEVYVRPFPDVQASRVTISIGGGEQPQWSPDGREIFYIDGSYELVSASVRETPGGLTVTGRETLFPVSDFSMDNRHFFYAVSPDGQSFYFATGESVYGAGDELIVVINWAEELKAQIGN